MRGWLITAVLASTIWQQGELTGRWSGTIDANGTASPLYARFTQGAKGVTGSIGSDTTKLTPISNVKVDGDLITFDVTWGDIAHISLKRQGNELKGELHGDGPPPPPGKHASIIAIVLERPGSTR